MALVEYGYTNNGLFPIRFVKTRKRSDSSLSNLSRGFKTKGVSKATIRKILCASRVLAFASEKRQVRNTKGFFINHHTMFVTLTLPAEQKHTDTTITNKVLANFFDRLRSAKLFQNYVWRAEKQENGNIHYHILTDTYCSFTLVRNYWYLALRSLGYMQDYKQKFSSMTFEEYRKLPFNKERDPQKVANSYAKGVRSQWSQPPCVDVSYCESTETAGAYISKYISKDSAGAENIVSGRVWSCSRSVSDSVKVWKTDKTFNYFWYNYARQVLRKKVFDSDFFSIVKCRLSSLLAFCSDVYAYLKKMLKPYFSPCEYFKNYVHIPPSIAYPT